LGPGLVNLTLHNVSSIPTDQLPVIRRMLEEDLKSSGISFTSSEGVNAVRVTLSENPAGGLWVAEIVEGNDTRVVMLSVNPAPAESVAARPGVALHREVIFRSSDLHWKSGSQAAPILAIAQAGSDLVVLTPEKVAVFAKSAQGWSELDGADVGPVPAGSRDPRGLVIPSVDGSSFTAFAPGAMCSGESIASTAGAQESWNLRCHAGDDPWPLVQAGIGQTGTAQSIRAFYNAGRDYFTGVVTAALGTNLPPFYTAALLPGRASGTALLLEATDGRVLVAENGQLRPVAGARDWGSDFAVISSACDAPAHVLVSSSGDGSSDSLRAFALPALEAAPVSDPLLLGGAAMALWPAPDAKSAMVVVRKAQQPGHDAGYEVDRVSESCN